MPAAQVQHAALKAHVNGSRAIQRSQPAVPVKPQPRQRPGDALPSQGTVARPLVKNVPAKPATNSFVATRLGSIQTSMGKGNYGGPGKGGYGYYYAPQIYYAPALPTTDDLEQAVQTGQDHRLGINRFGGFTPWQSHNFPGFNIEFNLQYTDTSGYVWPMIVHVKYNARRWWNDDPYAMSLKFANQQTLQNPTSGSHPGLFIILAAEARTIIANAIAWQRMNFVYHSVRVTRLIIQQMIHANDREGLAALYKSSHYPLDVWDSDAWSLFLDWNTG